MSKSKLKKEDSILLEEVRSGDLKDGGHTKYGMSPEETVVPNLEEEQAAKKEASDKEADENVKADADAREEAKEADEEAKTEDPEAIKEKKAEEKARKVKAKKEADAAKKKSKK